MSVISMKQLLEAGVALSDIRQEDGTLRWLHTFTQRRSGIYIIDLQKSVGKVDEAYQAVADIAAEGGTILFVEEPRSRLRMLLRQKQSAVECSM